MTDGTDEHVILFCCGQTTDQNVYRENKRELLDPEFHKGGRCVDCKTNISAPTIAVFCQKRIIVVSSCKLL